ncbi:substrate-binding domain-containing protein [Herbaspirillum sp. WKF16]|uniref:substrate-binding domain-containing protein n=1 Tax=Herbaspirillum sp. WKF16 TaxID=3028312 RepID=UPI0023A9E070|nr:substrate-binding domain-containing protein [Herbaspirillum sp. WKF16]WDZ95060.1 substrate-binding domain-containing protein [Herbaspirillum sp. WKF16]
MPTPRLRATLAASLLIAATLQAGARADDLKILAAGAIAPVVRAVAADFEQRSGVHVTVENATAGVMDKRIRGGEAFDAAVVPDGVLDKLGRDRYVQPGSARPIARVGIGVAVKEGAPAPAIATVAQFRRALLDAPSVALIDPQAGGSSGIYLEWLFYKLGIAAQMRAKQVLVPGGLVAQKLVDGSAALALHQESEILQVKGARLVGPLPAPIQSYTTYAGAIGSHAAAPAAAHAFLTLFAAAPAREEMQRHGMTPQ